MSDNETPEITPEEPTSDAEQPSARAGHVENEASRKGAESLREKMLKRDAALKAELDFLLEDQHARTPPRETADDELEYYSQLLRGSFRLKDALRRIHDGQRSIKRAETELPRLETHITRLEADLKALTDTSTPHVLLDLQGTALRGVEAGTSILNARIELDRKLLHEAENKGPDQRHEETVGIYGPFPLSVSAKDFLDPEPSLVLYGDALHSIPIERGWKDPEYYISQLEKAPGMIAERLDRARRLRDEMLVSIPQQIDLEQERARVEERLQKVEEQMQMGLSAHDSKRRQELLMNAPATNSPGRM